MICGLQLEEIIVVPIDPQFVEKTDRIAYIEI